jgi:hypothetical protein
MNIQDGSTGNTLRNNILLNENPSHGAIDISSDSLSGLTSDYNAVVSKFTTDGGNSVQSLAQWQAATNQDAHSVASTAAALFQSPTADDRRLLPNAPAVNGGTSLNAPTTDLDGKPRPIGAAVDIGAYELSASTIPGDYNDNGIIDAADYILWRHTLGSTASLAADGNDTHIVDPGDFIAWKMHFGATGSGAGSGRMSSVSEPSSLLLFSPAAFLILALRRFFFCGSH